MTSPSLGSSSSDLPPPPEWLKDLSAEEARKPDCWPPHQKSFYFDFESWQTHKAYRDPERTTAFSPEFSKARSQLDYSYHLIPAQSRQELQDVILSRVVNASKSDAGESSSSCEGEENKKSSKPWIVFTAGAMGVGKGYVLSSLYKSDLFPLASFLIIDPDKLKSELPEMSGYLQTDASTAATKVHRESTQMADVLLEHALMNQSNVLVDGSLRDVEYYKHLFQRIHKDYEYRIAIILVTADPQVIHNRATERAEKTGRAVPKELVDESIAQAPRSVKQLSSFADAVFEIANDEDKPLQLVGEASWDDFANTWTDEEPKDKKKKKTFILKKKCCKSLCKNMSSCWEDTEAHDIAKKIWGAAYPQMCPRCTLAEDGQCGVCIHGKHLCACKWCESACPVRQSFRLPKTKVKLLDESSKSKSWAPS
jgi:hypothetical protein